MKKYLALVLIFVCSAALSAESVVGVRLFDMYKTEAVSLMTRDEFAELKANISEEKRAFAKVYSETKREWAKKYTAARRAGDKDFPKFPTRPFIWSRTFKYQNFSTRERGEEWLAKQQTKIDAEMTAKAAAIEAANKAGKGAVTKGYASRDAKKAAQQAEKKQMESAIQEHLAEQMIADMAKYLKYSRPVPIHFIVDPVAGAQKIMQGKMEAQEKALADYAKRKAAAEAAEAADKDEK